jgi:hypothetical protein
LSRASAICMTSLIARHAPGRRARDVVRRVGRELAVPLAAHGVVARKVPDGVRPVELVHVLEQLVRESARRRSVGEHGERAVDCPRASVCCHVPCAAGGQRTALLPVGEPDPELCSLRRGLVRDPRVRLRHLEAVERF